MRKRRLRKRVERSIIIISLILMLNKEVKIASLNLSLEIQRRLMLETSKDLTIDHNIQLSLSNY